MVVPNLGVIFIGMALYNFVFNQNEKLLYLLWIPIALFVIWKFYFKYIKK